MPRQITLPDDSYAHLVAAAAAMHVTVDELARRAVDAIPQTAAADTQPLAKAPSDLSYAEWKQAFDEFNALVRSRADRYPPGFQADVSREAMYEGCGE